MKHDFHIIVIGGGSAGLVVASSASQMGAKVALIEKDKMGGDCLNTGCVPSKAFLRSAHLAKEIRESTSYGLNATLENIDLSKVMDRVKGIIKTIEPHDSVERFEKLGVRVYKGSAKFIDKNTVEVNGNKLTARNIVIATGSTAAIPPINGLKDIDYLTNENIFELKILPKKLIVLGGGSIGLELGQGFKNLGSEVTVIDFLPTLFSKDDPEVGSLMEKEIKGNGIELYLSSKIEEVKKTDNEIIVVIEKNEKKEEIRGDKVLVSLGRIPVSKDLDLEKAGVITDKRGFVTTNNRLQTNIKNIYACGDITGPYQFTHMAGYQAGIVVRNIIFKIPAKVNYSVIPWNTYTLPEVGHVGYTEQWAKAENLYKDKIVIKMSEIDRAITDKDTKGFLKLIIGKKNRIIGATIVGNKAGEMIHLATIAIKKKMKPSYFTGLIFAYPSESEIYKFAAFAYIKKNLKPWVKKLIKVLFIR